MPTANTPRAVLNALTRRAQALEGAAKKPLVALGALINALPLAAFVADDHGHYVLSNPAASHLTGYSERALRRMSVWDLTPSPTTREFEVLWGAFILQREQRGRYELVTKGGRLVSADYAARANLLPHLHVSVMRVRQPHARRQPAQSTRRVS